MRKHQINDMVYKLTHSENKPVFELVTIKEITNTCLGFVYDTRNSQDEIEICFGENLYKLNEIRRIK